MTRRVIEEIFSTGGHHTPAVYVGFTFRRVALRQLFSEYLQIDSRTSRRSDDRPRRNPQHKKTRSGSSVSVGNVVNPGRPRSRHRWNRPCQPSSFNRRFAERDCQRASYELLIVSLFDYQISPLSFGSHSSNIHSRVLQVCHVELCESRQACSCGKVYSPKGSTPCRFQLF